MSQPSRPEYFRSTGRLHNRQSEKGKIKKSVHVFLPILGVWICSVNRRTWALFVGTSNAHVYLLVFSQKQKRRFDSKQDSSEIRQKIKADADVLLPQVRGIILNVMVYDVTLWH